MKPDAKIICDSISLSGARLTTMEVTMHRFVLAEFNTHRVFSRNSASSRAIPIKRTIENVKISTAMPVEWGMNKPGMQSDNQLDDISKKSARNAWWKHAHGSIRLARSLDKLGLHKQIVNRVLEPFMWHKVIVTATEWDNFFTQRCHADAQPEMRAVADKMQLAYFRSIPQKVPYDCWHTPFIDDEDIKLITNWYLDQVNGDYCTGDWDADMLEIMKKVSVARCARVSYLNHDGKRDIGADLNLYDRLVDGSHWSPFEHVAKPMVMKKIGHEELNLRRTNYWSGNFYGWHQYRKQFKNENQCEFIPNLSELSDVRDKMLKTRSVKTDE